MNAEHETEPALEALLAARRNLDAADRAAVEALRAEATGADALLVRLGAAARTAMARHARGTARDAITLTIRAIGARVEALLGAGRILEPALVRGDGPGGVLVAHPFGGREARTHVDVDGDRFVVMLDLGAEGATRVSITRDGRELASEVPTHGRWLLPRLAEGRYRVEASGSDGTIAALDLVLERSAQ